MRQALSVLAGTMNAVTPQMIATIVVAVLAAVTSIVSAVIAHKNASRSRESQLTIERQKILEARLSTVKADVYRPMINALNDALGGSKAQPAQLPGNKGQRRPSQPDFTETTRVFSGWLSIVGSDDAVRVWRNFMQAAYSGAPPQILLRLYAEFVVAARRDMGDTDTKIGVEEVLGIRITDLYADAEMRKLLGPRLEDVAFAFGWQMPWTAPPPEPDPPSAGLAT